MKTEYINVTNSHSINDVDTTDIYEFDIPDQEMLDGLDTFISDKINLTSSEIIMELSDDTLKWLNDNRAAFKPETYKQIHYGCMDVKYLNYMSIAAKKRSNMFTKVFKKYKFAKALVSSDRARVFFVIGENDITFNMYIYSSRENKLIPHSILKVKIDDIIDIMKNHKKVVLIDNMNMIDECSMNSSEYFFLGITRDSYSSLNTMTNVSNALDKAPKKYQYNFIDLVRNQSKTIIFAYINFMIKLAYYKTLHTKVIKTKAGDDEHRSEGHTSSINENDLRIIYLDDTDTIVMDKSKSHICERTGRKIQHEFEVSGHERHYKSGKVISVKGYTKGKGLPKLKKKTHYIDGKKGEQTDQ